MSDFYNSVRANVDKSGNDSRVEVNQRALIDKILARYASAGAVYRELIQNSNDAEATEAEILFTTSEDGIVTQVAYRNNGMPFRPQDWDRLKKIAEGNPDVSKVGAFGVGAYTMFSICEEPLVISGSEALAFVWRGDALWTKTAPNTNAGPDNKWTSFILPSRDPYPLPDLVEFGEFLCASLTFTKCLMQIRVLVNDTQRLVIRKVLVQKPTLVKPPQSSSWWKNDGAVTASRRGTFFLSNPSESISESKYRVEVDLDGETASILARYVSATAKTRIPPEMARRMERVTKKKPPSEVLVQIYINADEEKQETPKSKAVEITKSFSPQVGSGRIYIGFRTSQTTGLAAHLAAPFIPTVEREAIDLQDQTLRIFNTELLEFSGILMRLTLEHSMTLIDTEWQKNSDEREKLEKQLESGEVSPKIESKQIVVDANGATKDTVEKPESSGGGRLFGFAKYMAKGLTKTIASVVSSVIDDGSELLNPKDLRPLSAEERHAILLMQSFCPQQSTPDDKVGIAVAVGFSRCMPNMSTPVLTRSGVMRGDEARLPHQGIESFVKDNVIRRIVYDNAKEYHTVIARSTPLNLTDLAKALTSEILEEEKVVLFIKWWTKYSQVDHRNINQAGLTIKDNIKFHGKSFPKNADGEVPIVLFQNLMFYNETKGLLAEKDIPMPNSVIPKKFQSEVGIGTLTHSSLECWFSVLPIEIWVDYIAHHTCMTAAQPEDETIRQKALLILSKEFSRKQSQERTVFGNYCQSTLEDKRCIPFDSLEPTAYSADCPSNLYLYSAELKAFDGIGSFHKAAFALKNLGVSEDFLLALGVRKSVAVDFLFANLNTLSWSNDPKPLVEYLRTATLSKKDCEKLQTTRYLPAENDSKNTFAPLELYLPDPELRAFPFIKLLQWPSDGEISERSPNGKFLMQIGVGVTPPLHELLSYISGEVKDDAIRIKALDYVCKRLGPHGDYQYQYSRLRPSQKNAYKILPCVVKPILKDDKRLQQVHSPTTCYSDAGCGIMGFPIIDPSLGEVGKLYASLFQCSLAPAPSQLLSQLIRIVTATQNEMMKIAVNEQKKMAENIIATFNAIFTYLSSQSSQFSMSLTNQLKAESFIPCIVEGTLTWYRPGQVYFKSEKGDIDSLTCGLFQALVDFSPFLATVGVREEATTKDLFELMMKSPQEVLDTLGSEEKYRTLLRRIAANPPFARVTPQIRRSPFLLAYTVVYDKNNSDVEKTNYKLVCAEEIYIIDNSFFGRMFPVNRAPHESDLEDFYYKLGSTYISKEVERRFEVAGKAVDDTPITLALGERIYERGPLLVSPSVTSRPLVQNAASVLEQDRLLIFEASNLLAVYKLNTTVRRQRVTCCSRPISGRKHSLYVTKDFDWFDVGYAIGDLILKRCQLEDAFFISSLLEAPIEQLRARGFPVGRILIKPEPIVVEPPPPPTPMPAKTVTPQPMSIKSEASSNPSPTMAQIPPSNISKNDAASKGAAPVQEKQKAGTTPSDSKARDKQIEKQSSSDPSQSTSEICTALKQMFPDADLDYIKKKLGQSPSAADIQSLAEEMASGKYPRCNAKDAKDEKKKSSSVSQMLKKASSGSSIRKKLGRTLGFGGGGGSAVAPTAPEPVKVNHSQQSAGGMMETPKSNEPALPEHDCDNHKHLESLLRDTVGKSASVQAQGVNAPETLLEKIPQELDRGSTCESIPAQSLKPYCGLKNDGKTHNGIRVFSSRLNAESEQFLRDNHAVVESFSLVILRLCSVYDLGTNSVAIFHDPMGGTIAFNSNRALHFNVRFFYSLHYLTNKHSGHDCYGYWFVTMAHELAHHLVSGHNKEHGFYTESYVSMYLPKLLSLLGTL